VQDIMNGKIVSAWNNKINSAFLVSACIDLTPKSLSWRLGKCRKQYSCGLSDGEEWLYEAVAPGRAHDEKNRNDQSLLILYVRMEEIPLTSKDGKIGLLCY